MTAQMLTNAIQILMAGRLIETSFAAVKEILDKLGKFMGFENK